MADSDGAVWIGSYGDGLFRASAVLPPAFHARRKNGILAIFTLFQDRSGAVWAGGMKACFARQGNGLVRVEPSPAPKENGCPRPGRRSFRPFVRRAERRGLLGYQAGQWTQYRSGRTGWRRGVVPVC